MLYKSIQEDKAKIEKDILDKNTVIFKDDYCVAIQKQSVKNNVSARDKLMQMMRK